MAESPALSATEKPLATPIRWLLVIPAAIGGAIGMAVIATLIIVFSGSGVNTQTDDLGMIGGIILVFITLSAPMA